jgi:uncharacterized Ntn-hydrolase superfamily protein
MELGLELIKLASVGVISGLFSAFIANKSHRDKKWWELRVSAYQSVIESLSDLIYYFDKKYTAEIENRELNEEFENELSKVWDESFHKVRKATDIGVFLFSSNVNSALQTFMKVRNDEHHSYFEYLNTNLLAAKNCLDSVVKFANIDLKR